MVALATAEPPDFGLLALDTNPSPSGAIDSLLYLQNLATEAQLYWIIGADAFQTLPKWPRCGEIGGLCEWLVAGRETAGVEVGLMGRSIDSAEDKMLIQTNHVCSVVATQMSLRRCKFAGRFWLCLRSRFRRVRSVATLVQVVRSGI